MKKSRFILFWVSICLLICISACKTNVESCEELPAVHNNDIVYEIEETAEPEIINTNEKVYEYIGNAKTKKLHYPDCGSARQMKEENKIYMNCTRDEAVSCGYVPCKHCCP